MTDHERVHEAIAAQESLRGTLPDDVIDMAVAALRAQLERGLAPSPVERRRRTRTFIMTSDGVIWAKERAQGAGALEDFPADPAADGWQQVP